MSGGTPGPGSRDHGRSDQVYGSQTLPSGVGGRGRRAAVPPSSGLRGVLRGRIVARRDGMLSLMGDGFSPRRCRAKVTIAVALVGVGACVASAASWARSAPATLHLSPAASSATTASPTPIRWSTPQLVSSPHMAKHQLVAIKCPTTSLCVALDDAGDILTSRNPGAGARAWKRAHVDRGLTAIACPSASLCVAVDSNGNAVTSTNPTRGQQAWKRTHIDGRASSPAELSAVACRSRHFCVAGDNNGNLVVSTDPTGGRRAWKVVLLPSNGDSAGVLSGLSCPTKSLCVGVDQSTGEGFIDDIFTSTDPTGGSKHWNLTTEFSDNSFNGVSCPTRSLCVAATDGGEVVTSTKPTHSSAWHATELKSNVSLNAVTCPSASLCITGDSSGAVETSADPTGGATHWQSASIAPGDSINSLSCPSVRLCIAVTGKGDVLVGRR
jgi:hypothetical protein